MSTEINNTSPLSNLKTRKNCTNLCFHMPITAMFMFFFLSFRPFALTFYHPPQRGGYRQVHTCTGEA